MSVVFDEWQREFTQEQVNIDFRFFRFLGPIFANHSAQQLFNIEL